MTRGNQREIDRARAAARNAKGGAGGREDGLTPLQRNERDAKAIAEKLAKKEADKAAAAEKEAREKEAAAVKAAAPVTGDVKAAPKKPETAKKTKKKKDEDLSFLADALGKKKK